MIIEKSRIVQPDTRPGGDKRCFYCEAPVGSPHRESCVCFLKTLVVRLTVDVVISSPVSHEANIVEFAYSGEGSYCSDNIMDDLATAAERMGCSCGFFEATVLRDATQEDHDTLPVLCPPAELDPRLIEQAP